MSGHKILRRLLIVYFFTFLAAPVSYFIRIFYARSLTIQEYGIFFSVLALLGLINSFNDLGTSPALVHYLPKFIKNRSFNKIKSVMTLVLILEAATFLILLAAAWLFGTFIAESFFGTSLALNVLLIFIIAFFLEGIFDLMVNIFRGYRLEGYYSSSNPLRLFAQLAFSIILFFIFKNSLLIAFSWAWLLSFAFVIIAYYFPISKISSGLFSIKSMPGMLRLDKETCSKIMKYGFFVMFSSAAAMLLSRIDVIMLTYFKGVESVAFYEIALPIATIMLVVITPVTSFMFPNISHYFHSKQIGTIRGMLKAIYNTGLFLFLPLGLIFFLFPQEIIIVLFGAKYAPAKIALKILAIGFIFKAFSGINFTVADGIGEVRLKGKIIIAGALLNVILNLILIPFYSIAGAAMATSISFFFMFISSLVFIEKKVRFGLSYGNIAKILINCGMFLGVVYGLKTLLDLNIYAEAAIVIIAAGAIYLAVGFWWRILDYKGIKELFLKTIRRAE